MKPSFLAAVALGACVSAPSNPPDPARPDLGGACAICESGTRCHRGACAPDLGTCAPGGECGNDSYCDCFGSDCACVPWGPGLGPRGAYDASCATPDFTVTAGRYDCGFVLLVEVCNRGGLTAPAPVYAAFFDGDPRAGGTHLLCSATTRLPLQPGNCRPASCTLPTRFSPPSGAFFIRANDDGVRFTVAPECDVDNDVTRQLFDCTLATQ